MINNMKASSDKKKLLFVFIGIFLLFVAGVFSYAYVAGHVDHSCEEEDCAICRSIDFCLSASLKKTIITSFLFVEEMILLYELCRQIKTNQRCISSLNPVSGNIRLNN